MKIMIKIQTTLITLLVAGAPHFASAENTAPEPASASLDVAALSDYVWRGQVLGKHLVLQPTLTVNKGGFSISWFGNLETDDAITGDSFEFSEHDISVAYKTALPRIGADLTAGLVNYDFPNIISSDAAGNASLVNDTREAFLGLAFDNAPLAPALSVSYDFKEADGFYGSLGLSRSLPLADRISLDLSATLGIASDNWFAYYFGGGKKSGLTDYNIGISLPITITENLSLVPSVTYAALLGDAKDAVEGSAGGLYYGETDRITGGITASYTF